MGDWTTNIRTGGASHCTCSIREAYNFMVWSLAKMSILKGSVATNPSYPIQKHSNLSTRLQSIQNVTGKSPIAFFDWPHPLTFYLTWILAIWHSVWHCNWQIFWNSNWCSIWHSIWHSITLWVCKKLTYLYVKSTIWFCRWENPMKTLPIAEFPTFPILQASPPTITVFLPK